MQDKIEMSIIALSKSKTSENNYVIVLEDENSKKRLPILIGGNEAQYIGIVLERLNTKRPMTHDLLNTTIEALGGKVKYIYIHELKQEIFVAEVVIQQKESADLVHIDARASDAIALATKTGVPIYTNEDILNQASFLNEIYVIESNKTSFNDYSIPELEELLLKVIQKEDYESAIRIRETIQRKKVKPKFLNLIIMHEISLVRNVFNTLHHEFDDETIPKIKKIKIIAGVLSNIEPILMQNAFEAVVATDAPEFKDAIMDIQILPVIIECLHCQTKSEIKNYTFVCSFCQKPSNNIIQGNELLISGVEVE